MNAPGEERVAEIRQQCEAASYLDGPTYEDMEYLLTRLREVEGERDRLKEQVAHWKSLLNAP